MNLGTIRAKFITLSGRDDLVNADSSDNGANYFINAGQRMLDRKIDFRKSTGRLFEELAADSWYLKTTGVRSLDQVWVNDSESRWILEKKNLTFLHKEFPDLISETDTRDPLYWSPALIRGMDVTDMDAQGSFFNYVLAEADNDEYTGLVILPPPDVSIVVELIGKFYSPTLSSDSDESYWTVVHEDLLIMAALYRLEVSYRNTEGANDWLRAITDDLMDIDKDTVHEDNANVDQLEG